MHRRQMLPVFPEALALSSSDSSSSTSVSQLGNSTDRWQTSSDSQTDYSRPPTPSSSKNGHSLSRNPFNHQGDVKGFTQSAVTRSGRPIRLASFLDVEDTRLESFLDMEDTPRPEQHFRLETFATEDLGYESEQEPDAQNGRSSAIKKTRIKRKTTSARRNRRKIALTSTESDDNSGLSLDPPSKPRLVPQSLPDLDLSPILDLPPLLLPAPLMDSSTSLQQSAVTKSRDRQIRTGRQQKPRQSFPKKEQNIDSDAVTIEDALSDLLGRQYADGQIHNRGRQDGGVTAKRILGLHTPPDSSEGELEDAILCDMETFSVAMAQLNLFGRTIGPDARPLQSTKESFNDPRKTTTSRTDEWPSFMDLS